LGRDGGCGGAFDGVLGGVHGKGVEDRLLGCQLL
jgi:hypothetical protein